MSTAGREVPAGFKTILLDRGKKLVFPHKLSFFLVSPPMSFASKQTAKASRIFFDEHAESVFADFRLPQVSINDRYVSPKHREAVLQQNDGRRGENRSADSE